MNRSSRGTENGGAEKERRNPEREIATPSNAPAAAWNERLSLEVEGLRNLSIISAWRLLLYQPNYYLVKKWQAVLLNPKAHARARKRAIIAFARQLFIDLWRWQTGRRTPEQLGWVMTQG